MPIYPGAIYKPITVNKNRRRLTEYNRVNLHTAVSPATSLHSYFNQSGKPDSHFYVREDGAVEQYVDTSWRAFADLDGNDATISIESWDGYGRVPWPGGQPPPWTPAQVASIVALVKWICATHGIPARLAQDSRVGSSSHGISWHRIGIDGAFPRLPDMRAGRLQRGGGMHYSKSAGKVCPGDARIAQIPAIAALVAAAPAPDPAPVPTPTPASEEDDDMGFYFYYSTSDSYYWFSQPRGKVRKVTKDEWSFLSAVSTGAVPAVPGIQLHQVSRQWYDRAIALGTY